jgi:surfactin synthase thioesterase subunit
MKYFNGFCLVGEEALFEDYLNQSDYCVAGFSYGAQEAFEYVYKSTRRIERLILLSPAFFQDNSRGFKRTQLRYFDAGKEAYIQQFLSNVTYPKQSDTLDKYLVVGTKVQLQSLLEYQWDKAKIKEVIARGTIIEVFMGKEDKIVNTAEVLAFFDTTKCISYTLKDSGHLLNA